ncbi:periplasmic beta-glucosidase [Candidatus Halobonum tyrrellensis G22]|uniref:beta-glucosidase n=1 Tax=Candidatus Halobonum tyrrellensis G22 TaxID=1324957 RepID=V4GUY9_9EURY|nr:periplasmic beta-glucosidase [Candidatus Halobonum tyrrellensis G22]
MAATAAFAEGASAAESDPGEFSQRVRNLLSEMTLEEKVGQMTQMAVSSFDPEEVGDLFTEHHVGSILSGGAAPPSFEASEVAAGVNRLQEWAMENTRLGVPFVYGVDAVHGNDLVYDAPIFPHNLGVGATWDPSTAREMAALTGESVRAMGAHWTFSPANDIQRDPRWGRFYEGFTESVRLAERMGRAKVEGYERATDQYDKAVGACQKHFAGYSQPLNGNDRTAAQLPARYLRQFHLPPHEAGIDAGAETVMVNSSSVNGVPAHASKWLLTDLLRGEWGYEGMVVSDWKDFKRMVTIHNYAADLKEATMLGVNAGVDMYMNPDDVGEFTSILVELVEEGKVSRDRIDQAVARVLRFKENVGLFDQPVAETESVSETISAGLDDARETATKSMTLLQNADDTLPLDPDLGSVLVAGPRIDNPLMQMGGWTLGWQGLTLDSVDLSRVPATTVVEGVENAVSSSTEVVTMPIEHTWDVYGGLDEYSFDNPGEVETAADEADAAVVVVGEGPYSEGPGDANHLHLHPAQQELVDTVAGTDTPLIGVVIAGRPRGTEVFDRFDASVMAYQPGSAGGDAIADVLFGEVNPGGHLPFRWPVTVGQVPNVHNALHPVDDPPRFEFGHGMSYTSFEYTDLQVSTSGGSLTASVSVTNAGDRAGDDVVQVSATRDSAPVIYPQRTLVGFERVSLDPGETRRVEITSPLSTLAVVPGDMTDTGERVVPAGEFRLFVDGLETTFTLDAPADGDGGDGTGDDGTGDGDHQYYQVDFVAGQPIEELGEEGLYAEQDRLMRFARGTAAGGILDKGTAWPSAEIRECLDYGHIGVEDGTASIRFTVADGCERTVSLAVYETPNESFSAAGADEQEYLRASTETFGPGEHTVSVDVPSEE